MIHVRIAVTSDRVGIDKITEEFDEHDYSHPPSYYDDCLATNKILVAVENETILGYVVHHIIWGNTPFIELLQISSSHQKRGIGTRLVTSLEAKLKSEGFETLLSSSEKVNSMGNAFHQKVGFHKIGELDMVYGKEIFYRRQIS